MAKIENDIKNHKQVFEDLNHLRAMVEGVIEDVKSLFWENCEYPAAAQGSNIIEPGCAKTFTFGVEYPNPDPNEFFFAGLPETAPKKFGIPSLFELQRLIIDDDECASKLALTQMLIGQRIVFAEFMRGLSEGVSAERFSASAAPIPINQYVVFGLDVMLSVRNNSDAPIEFKAKIVGRRQTEATPDRAPVATLGSTAPFEAPKIGDEWEESAQIEPNGALDALLKDSPRFQKYIADKTGKPQP